MKKKLIAIVTSLAMVATMVPATAAAATQPGTAGTKTVAQTQALDRITVSFITIVEGMPEAANILTGADAIKAAKDCSRAESYLGHVPSTDKDDSGFVAAEKKFGEVVEKIEKVCVPLMVSAINEKAQAGKVVPNDPFEAISELQDALLNSGMKLSTIRSKVENYSKFEDAQVAKDLADVIDGQKSNLSAATLNTLDAAVHAIEYSPAYIDAGKDEVRAYASNYKLFKDAKDKVTSMVAGEVLLNEYTTKFTNATSGLPARATTAADPLTGETANSMSAARIKSLIRDAEALMAEADQNTKVTAALKTYDGKTAATNYTTARTALKTKINTASSVVEDKRLAEIFRSKVDALPAVADLKLENVAAAEEVYQLMKETEASGGDFVVGTTTGAFGKATNWGLEVSKNTKDAAYAKVNKMATILTALTAADKDTKQADAKTIIKSFNDAIPESTGITTDHEALLTGAKAVFDLDAAGADASSGAYTILGADRAAKLDFTAPVDAERTALKAKIATDIKSFNAKDAQEEEAATAFITTVIKKLNGMTGKEADYDIELDKAMAAYNKLPDAYKKGGAEYNNFTASIDGVTYTVENAYDTEKTENKKPYALKTLINNRAAEKSDAEVNAVFNELVNGINALPATVTIANQDAVYALRDKRAALTTAQKTAFKENYKTYDEALDKAIKAVDEAVVADLNKTLGELTIIDAKATPEDIQKAKAANKAARDEYEKLTDSQKAVVTNYPNLQAAEAAVEAAEVQYAKDQMAAVIKDIDLNALTEEQAKAILAVNDMINALNGAQKTEVEKDSNYAAFQEAVKAANGGKPIDPIDQPKDLAKDASVASIAAQTYNGKAKTPAVTVTAGGKTLVQGTDYTATYKNNTNIGRATVTITGAGDYTGTITKTFIITPAKGTVTKVTAGKKKVTVSYKTQKSYDGKTGYRIICKAKGLKAIGVNTTAAGKKTVSKLKSGKTYQVKVRAYKTIGGHKYYGSYSAVKKVKVK